MSPLTHVKVTKLSRLPGRPDGDFIGLDEGGSITEGYWIKGTCSQMPQIGRSFRVSRDIRNGRRIYGLFATSRVQSIESSDDIFTIHTENSIYRVEVLA